MARYRRQHRLEAIRNAGRIRRVSSFSSTTSAASSRVSLSTPTSAKTAPTKMTSTGLMKDPTTESENERLNQNHANSNGRDGILKTVKRDSSVAKQQKHYYQTRRQVKAKELLQLSNDQNSISSVNGIGTFSTAPSSSFESEMIESASSIDESLDSRPTISTTETSNDNSNSSQNDNTSSLVSLSSGSMTTNLTNKLGVEKQKMKTMTTTTTTTTTTIASSNTAISEKSMTSTSIFRTKSRRHVSSSTKTRSCKPSVGFIGIGGAPHVDDPTLSNRRFDNYNDNNTPVSSLDEDDFVDDSQRIPKSVMFIDTNIINNNDTSIQMLNENHVNNNNNMKGKMTSESNPTTTTTPNEVTVEDFEDEPHQEDDAQSEASTSKRIASLVRGLVRFGNHHHRGTTTTTKGGKATNDIRIAAHYGSRTAKYNRKTSGSLTPPPQPPTMEELLPLGTRCIILRGQADDDVGQLGVVIRHTTKRVMVSYLSKSGTVEQKLKDPKSLIGFRNKNVIMEECEQTGQLWITTSPPTPKNVTTFSA